MRRLIILAGVLAVIAAAIGALSNSRSGSHAVVTSESPGDVSDRRSTSEDRLLAQRLVKRLVYFTQQTCSITRNRPSATWVAMERYVLGWTDAVRALGRPVVPVLAEEMSEHLCSATLTADQLIVLANVGRYVPSILTTRGLECAFRRQLIEDDVLWSLLDAWTAAGRPRIGALSLRQSTFKNPITFRRLAGFDYERRERLRTMAAQSLAASNR
jgi:hypothetical protein